MKYEHAIVKFNNGNGALLCNKCNIIIAYGFKHEDKEHICDSCKAGVKPETDEEVIARLKASNG